MKFGRVDHPELIDFTLPADDAKNIELLKNSKQSNFKVCVGCAKWNRTDLKGFYPRGTKDELAYYSTQFNSIELNAVFYRIPSPDQVVKWRDKTPDDFLFFPKINQAISHLRRLNDVDDILKGYIESIKHFQSKLGMVFLQLHDNFKPKNIDRLEQFIGEFPAHIPLAVELRNTEWFNNESIQNTWYSLLEKNKVANIIVDAAGRRDLLHMRLTTPTAFVRYVGANHFSDYSRLDDWVERIAQWKESGLNNLYFFVHQNEEKESPKLASYFITKLNNRLGLSLRIPDVGANVTLF